MLRSILRPIAIIATLAGLGAYATIMLKGPQGIRALDNKRQEIRLLEEQNADLQRQVNEKKQRIERLEHDPGTQELEIRKRLKMQKQGDTQFILPDRSTKPDSSAAATGGSK